MEDSNCRRASCHNNDQDVVLKIVARRPMVAEMPQHGSRGHGSVCWLHHCVVLIVMHVLLHHSTTYASAAVSMRNGGSFNASPASIKDDHTSTTDSSSSGATTSSSSSNSSNSSIADTSKRHRSKRSVIHLYHMITCTTNCNPFSYKGYGCYCGFMGKGAVVDGIDQCCKEHDWCYEKATFCSGLQWYLASYNWRCNDGRPYCVRPARGLLMTPRTCGHQLCDCDRAFAECLRHQPCPKKKAMCLSSPWRLAQNIFMALLSGSGLSRENEVDY